MSDPRESTFLLGDRTYDFAKKLVQFILPAFGTFYVAMAQLWDWPHADKVSGSILAFCAFLGAVIGISNAQYNASGKGFDGKLLVQRVEGEGSPLAVTGVHYGGDTQALQEKSSLKLKVEEVVPIKEPDVEPEEDEGPPQNPATRSKR